ncbi:unnamed protein product [Clonostachys rosea]|uniref:Rhodopsin domain-containing protein n=1 Tax=Bionectria ochroleuca TaxID=29856 RepID=A0ABY6U8K3_BIOOC|nr:unnamed protein product [Clonostachys rosea]
MTSNSALIETWCLYAVGSLIFMGRIACRIRTIGVAGFKPDDYIVFLSWGTYTVMTVAAYFVGKVGDLHTLSEDERKNLTDEEAKVLHRRRHICPFIWTLKLNMLFLYQRVVKGLWVSRFIKPTIYLVIGTFVATYLILFCACRPYSRMWTVYPDQGGICRPDSVLNMVPALVMNIITDVLIMAIPAPVVIPIKTALWKRITLIALFGAGLFIMIAAILRVTMVLVMKTGSTAAIWSCREDFVAIVVGQAILVRPIFTRNFWAAGTYRSSGAGYSSKNSANLGGSEIIATRRSRQSRAKDPFSMTVALATIQGDGSESTDGIIDSSTAQIGQIHTIRECSRSSSEEDDLESGRGARSGKMVIHVSKDVRVEKTGRENGGHLTLGRSSHSLRATSRADCWNETQAAADSENQQHRERP